MISRDADSASCKMWSTAATHVAYVLAFGIHGYCLQSNVLVVVMQHQRQGIVLCSTVNAIHQPHLLLPYAPL